MQRCTDWMALFLLACVLTLFAYPACAQEKGGKPPRPIATFTTGWTYLWADQGANYRANLNGWFVKPALNLPRGYSVFVSSTNYYGKNAKGSVNSHGFTSGLVKEVVSRPKVKLTVFAEAGDVRASSGGTITNELLVAGGIGVSVPIRRWVSLSVTPAEYIFLYPKGDWRNDCNAKVGLSFPIGYR